MINSTISGVIFLLFGNQISFFLRTIRPSKLHNPIKKHVGCRQFLYEVGKKYKKNRKQIYYHGSRFKKSAAELY